MPVFCNCMCWTPCSSQKGSMKYSLCLSALLSAQVDMIFSWNWISEFCQGARNPYVRLCMTEPDFFGKPFFAPKIWEMGRKEAKNWA